MPADVSDGGCEGPIFSSQTLPHAKRSVGFMLSKLGLVTSGRFHEALSVLGIHPAQCHLMLLISENEGQSQQALAEELAIPKSRMVALVDELELRGFVERRQNPGDRRQHALHMTSAGADVFARAIEIANEHESEVCASLSEAERKTMLKLLGKMVDAEPTGHPLDSSPELTAKLWPATGH